MTIIVNQSKEYFCLRKVKNWKIEIITALRACVSLKIKLIYINIYIFYRLQFQLCLLQCHHKVIHKFIDMNYSTARLFFISQWSNRHLQISLFRLNWFSIEKGEQVPRDKWLSVIDYFLTRSQAFTIIWHHIKLWLNYHVIHVHECWMFSISISTWDSSNVISCCTCSSRNLHQRYTIDTEHSISRKRSNLILRPEIRRKQVFCSFEYKTLLPFNPLGCGISRLRRNYAIIELEWMLTVTQVWENILLHYCYFCMFSRCSCALHHAYIY